MPFGIRSLIFTVLAVFLAPAALSVPIDPNISIVGTTLLDDNDPDLLSASNSYSASMYNVVNGSNTSGNSNNVAISHTGDGFGHTASLSGDSSSTSILGGDYSLNASNSSLSDTFKLTFGITFSHSADADGGDLDARARSKLDVDNGAGTEFLYSRLTSESGKDYYDAGNPTWQDQVEDEVGGSYLGTWGDLLSFGETRYFDITLGAGDDIDIFGLFTVDGRLFDSGASYDMTSSMFLFLDDFENLSNPTSPPNNVPEPGSFMLLLIGLLSAGFTRKIKHRVTLSIKGFIC